MHDHSLEAKIRALSRLGEAELFPFPYDDCFRLRSSQRGSRKRYRDLIPDLDIYFSWVWGNSGWGGKTREWSPERIQKSHKLSSASFFEWFPAYKPLKLQVVKWRYPELHQEFKKHDKMRRLLGEVTAHLLAQPDLSQIEVTVQKKERDNPLRPRQPSRKMRLAHRQVRSRLAIERREAAKKPVKFQGPALRFIQIKPLGESLF